MFRFSIFLAALLSIGMAGPCCLAEEGFESLFDGKSLAGWDGNPEFWRVENGCIVGQTTEEKKTRGNTFLIWRGGETADFELKAEYRIVGGNSGLQYRSFEVPNEMWVIGGYQADIDSNDRYSGINYGERFRGILADRGQKTVIGTDHKPKVVGSVGDSNEIQSKIKKEDWNEYHIIAKDFRFEHRINGVVTSECVDEDVEKRRDRGVLALQLHAGPPMKIEFRNIRLKKLVPAKANVSEKDKKRVLFLAGKRSHGFGAHDHTAGCALLARHLTNSGLSVDAEVHSLEKSGWPEKEKLAGAAAIVIYADGGGGHPFNSHLAEINELANRKVGIVCLHYGVETTKGEAGNAFLNWTGGYFETDWSVNPHWKADFKKLPKHPISSGVLPFTINDEWYYHMRFREGMQDVTPILSDIPTAETLTRKDGPHSGNPHVRKAVAAGEPQHVAWAGVRPDGGRGFGFTGGHFHWNWGHPQFRKLVLNAIAWSAQLPVPADGVKTPAVSVDELLLDHDEAIPADFNKARIEAMLNEFSQVASTSEKTSATQSTEVKVSGNRPRPEDHHPSQAVQGLDSGDGLEATLFAAEPLLANPSTLDVDHLGRVWVGEVMNYRRFANKDFEDRKEGDRILILEDTNGDGTADRSTVFYQGRDIDSLHGLCVLGNRVIVSARGAVFLLFDDDGDSKADRKVVLFSGIDGADHDHGIHAAVIGPDGKMYFNFGNAGKRLKDAKGEVVVDRAGRTVEDNGKPYREGMIFRCNTDGSNVETLAWNFRNNWETCVDSFGAMWQSDNDDDGNRGVRINFVMPYGNYGYKDEISGASWSAARTNLEPEIPQRHWHLNDPGVVPNLLQTGAGSPTGICVYEGTLLPKVFHNQLIHCDAGPNVVRAYPVEKDGAGYRATMANVLTGTRDNWFRPSDVAVAPDGSLYIADWYDPGVGGHRQKDIDRGRIFRVAPPKVAAVHPKYDLTTIPGALVALQSPNLSARTLAAEFLRSQGGAAETALETLFQQSVNTRIRARAFWLLSALGTEKGIFWIKKGLADSAPEIRQTAIRAATANPNFTLDWLIPLRNDPDLGTRREVILAIQGQSSDKAAVLWGELARQYDGKDRWYLEALGIAAQGDWDRFLAAWMKQAPDALNTSAGRDIVWRSRASITAEYLAKIVLSPNTPLADLPKFFRAFDFQQVSQGYYNALTTILDNVPSEKERHSLLAIETLMRLAIGGKEVDKKYLPAIEKLLDERRGSAEYLTLVSKLKLKSRYPEVLEQVQSQPDSQFAVDAVRLLLNGGGEDFVRKAIQSEPVKAAATVRAISHAVEGRTLNILKSTVADTDLSEPVRQEAIRGLSKSRAGGPFLMEQIQAGTLTGGLKDLVGAALHMSLSPENRTLANESFPLPVAANNSHLPPVADLLKLKGDPERGRTVFSGAGTCSKCHVVHQEGKDIGPNLTEIGSKLSRESMFESILFPSAGISHNFETYSVVLHNGTAFSGILSSQSEQAITVKGADGLVRTIERKEIDEIVKQPVSLMPADLQKTMSAEQLVDVVAYLQSLKKK